jgi:hypothetical protein
MDVKGTGLVATRNFVKEMYGSKFNDWINSLPSETKAVYNGVIQTGNWYDIEKFYYVPLKKIAELFFNNDEKKAALTAGVFSAEFGLKGVYKVFLMIASPQALMKASKRIIALYYQPVNVEIDEVEKHSLVLSCTKMMTTSKLLDYRVIGWCVKALELANCKNVNYEEVTAKYPNMFSIKLTWN